MLSAHRRGFTLIELLVVLAIISMILALAIPAISGLLRSSRIIAATDVIRSAVSKTRSAAISSRKSCSLDMSHTEETGTTERLTTSSILTNEDFERYPVDWDAVNEVALPMKVEESTELRKNWSFYPEQNSWEIVPEQSRELWIGRDKQIVGNVYAWHTGTLRRDKPETSVEMMIQGRFRFRRITDSQREWGFGLLAHFGRSSQSCGGYRLAVRVQTEKEGWNFFSRAKIEKISSSNPSQETCYDAGDPDPSSDLLGTRDLDEFQTEVSAAVTPGVWYWAKLNVKRENLVVTIAGKVWVEGSPEPTAWTVGPVIDAWPGATLPTGTSDNIPGGDNPRHGGSCGVWCYGGETAIDDFSVDWRDTWFLPKHIHLQPQWYDTSASSFHNLGRYEEGSFPLAYRPDGTATAARSVFVLITNVSSGAQRMVQIDHNTGRVETADQLLVQQ